MKTLLPVTVSPQPSGIHLVGCPSERSQEMILVAGLEIKV